MINSQQIESERESQPDNARTHIVLAEWQARDVVLTRTQTMELLSLTPAVLEIHTLPTGETRIRPGAIVGRLSTPHLDLLIRPKCPVPSLLLMLAEVHELSRIVPQLAGYETSPDIVDLLVQVYLRQVDHVLRLGLKRGYVFQQEDLLAVRGRVNLRRSLALHLRGQPRLDCSYEDFTLDVPENQYLLAALRAMAANRALPSQRRSLAHRLGAEFCGVGELPPGRDQHAPACDRLNLHYDPALKMAELLLHGMGIEHELGAASINGFTLNMNQLFEGFVSRRLKKTLEAMDCTVRLQHPYPFDAERQATIKPDIVIQGHTGRRVVADAKYKLAGVPAPEDLYQMLAYCRILKIPWGLLITAGDAGRRTYVVNDEATTIEVIPITLSKPIQEINESLDRLARRIHARLTTGGTPRTVVNP